MRAGLNYVDTSPFYGEGKSEEVLGMITTTMSVMMMMMGMVAVLIMIYSLNTGNALRRIPRETFYIGTKVPKISDDCKILFLSRLGAMPPRGKRLLISQRSKNQILACLVAFL